LTDFQKNTQIYNFMKTRLVEAELFYADRHEEVNTRFSQFCECIYKEDMKIILKRFLYQYA